MSQDCQGLSCQRQRDCTGVDAQQHCPAGVGKEGTAVAGLAGAPALVIKGKHPQERPDEDGLLGTVSYQEEWQPTWARGLQDEGRDLGGFGAEEEDSLIL